MNVMMVQQLKDRMTSLEETLQSQKEMIGVLEESQRLLTAELIDEREKRRTETALLANDKHKIKSSVRKKLKSLPLLLRDAAIASTRTPPKLHVVAAYNEDAALAIEEVLRGLE